MRYPHEDVKAASSFDQPSPFRSFLMGGFECATHRRRDLTRMDVTAACGHDTHCAEDYRLLAEAGVLTVRDGVRWHLVEAWPGTYEWTSLLPMIEAANATGTQVIWDLCHWGVPDWVDLFSPGFITQFEAFAAAAVRFILKHRRLADPAFPDLFCAINEMSFWAWVGGDQEHFHPYGGNRGPALKEQLVRASLAGIRAARAVEPSLLFVQPEPGIHISADDIYPEDIEPSAIHTESQFEAQDMLLGLQEPELGGFPEATDFIGLNYYWNNQWIMNGPRTPPGHHLHRPLHLLLQDLWQRYARPVLITETGAEADAAVGWLGYVATEVRQARSLGVPVLGNCLYPVMDYPGWDDERHCPCGLIEVAEGWVDRSLRADLADEVRLQERLLSATELA